MILHKSHSKNDIVEIIELLNIPINDPNDLNKHQLQSKMIKYMSKNKNQLFLPNHMFISTMDNLIEHLENLNQLKINGQSTRANVMKKAKKLIAYANNDYFFFLNHILIWTRCLKTLNIFCRLETIHLFEKHVKKLIMILN